MATALSLQHYLAQQDADYDVLSHAPTMSSPRTAEECHVSASCLAKGVVMKGGGSYILAVLPASHHIEIEQLGRRLSRPVSLATEDEIETLFPDCVRGAVPPIGAAYGIATIVDDSIAEKPDIYFEGGDHTTLVHMAGSTFARLMGEAPHARFSNQDGWLNGKDYM